MSRPSLEFKLLDAPDHVLFAEDEGVEEHEVCSAAHVDECLLVDGVKLVIKQSV